MQYTHKPVEELTFTDDFMFGTVMKNKVICKGVLERLLHIKVGKIEYPSHTPSTFLAINITSASISAERNAAVVSVEK